MVPWNSKECNWQNRNAGVQFLFQKSRTSFAYFIAQTFRETQNSVNQKSAKCATFLRRNRKYRPTATNRQLGPIAPVWRRESQSTVKRLRLTWVYGCETGKRPLRSNDPRRETATADENGFNRTWFIVGGQRDATENVKPCALGPPRSSRFHGISIVVFSGAVHRESNPDQTRQQSASVKEVCLISKSKTWFCAIFTENSNRLPFTTNSLFKSSHVAQVVVIFL